MEMETPKTELIVPSLSIEYRRTADLKKSPSNARTHSKRQIRQIAASITEFSFTNPIIVDHDSNVVAGHGRLDAAKLLGLEEVPTVRLEHLTKDQIRAYIIADNRLAELAGWDREILATELEYLSIAEDLEVTVTGFDIGEIDQIIEDASSPADPDDDPTTVEQGPAITQAGDLWELGKHRLLCGNALKDDPYATLMGKQKAGMVITDPPYNVPIGTHAGGNGSIHHPEFAMASGEMSEPEFISFLTTVLKLLSRYSTPEALQYIFMDWRHQYELLAAGRQVYDELLNLCVWSKNAAGMGSFYRSMHELILVYRNGKGRHRNNVQLGKFGRNRSNIWAYPNVHAQSLQGDEGNLLALHPTVKPIALVADAILDCTARGEIVLDSFLGSGTSLMAAERIGRICHGIEISPAYVDTAIRRWQRYTGESAVHAATREAFNDRAPRQQEAHHG